MDNCIFCKIIKDEIPCYKIYEDNDFLSFLDIAPGSKGHTLIIPKEHAATLEDLPDDKASKLLPLAKKIVKAMKEVHGFTNFNIIQNNGKIAGQTVDHFHLHIIPRYSIEEVGLWTPHEGDPSVNEENAKLVRDKLM